ncbi:MAG: beta-galactosidase, partial [Candidatus Eremiobacteraeota bacterium]|nr:beta-galactosidase [Candidatus Eremiobacteraeota bacterium]
AAVFIVAVTLHANASASTWNASAVVQQNGTPVFTVGGKPFFIYGAAFFYERMPREQWDVALERYKAFGINTIDLYVPWNWHELQEADFDFSGRTNPRRDLRGLLREIHARGYKIVLRPGPVIRNEWRNGGYPTWLLTRPEYNMPLHDVLEGRYPATATLQNAHSDAAAAEWMRNKTHMRYATRWLRTVLREFEPYHEDVIAIALDDDQGAYIDNDTWLAPHFHAYIHYLESVVQSVTGPRVPLFINSYQMKVTASAPVWAWGNWYQSDAYSIGEHDRTQLEFSTALLQTQPHLPVMVSEFQAGWLQNADEAYPRPADPTNTELALHTMLQMGAHGVVNFPLQDTFNPPGFEAPWANAYYAWDAALAMDPVATGSGRWRAVSSVGDDVFRYGRALATTSPINPVAIVWVPSALEHAPSNEQFAVIADRVQSEQRRCRALNVGCGMVDLAYSDLAILAKYRVLIVPAAARSLTAAARLKLVRFVRAGGAVISTGSRAALSKLVLPYADAALLADSARKNVFLDIVNYGTRDRTYQATSLCIGDATFNVPALSVGARSARLVPLAVAETSSTTNPARSLPFDRLCPQGSALRGSHRICYRFAKRLPVGISRADLLSSGFPDVIFRTRSTILLVSPMAGARSFIFQFSDGEVTTSQQNYFSTVGALRDDVSLEIPVSPRDYIGKYTHPISAGMFNRPYAVKVLRQGTAGSVEFTYDAPDALPHGAFFDRVVSIDPKMDAFIVDEKVTFHGAHVPSEQAHVMRTSFAETSDTVPLTA